jgi:quaternary ammonium compound-resistance protein SugE
MKTTSWLSPVLFLFTAGLLETVWVIGLKYTLMYGLTRLWPIVLTAAAMSASIYFLGRSLKTIPVGTGYAVWTGIGAAGTAIVGIALFGESCALSRLVGIAFIIAGVALALNGAR